jgi:glycosyltransferase involved in cell wall biosynthesis
MKKKSNFALVIPAHNEEPRIGKVLEEAKRYASQIIVVDDGSEDKTVKIAESFKVTVLSHLINLGKGAALKTGCEAAFKMGAQVVVTLDSDGQHNPGDIPRFIKSIQEKKIDFVLGSRNLGFGMPLIRIIGNKIDSFLIKLFFGIYVTDPLCGFRALTRKAYQKIIWESSGYGVETEMIAKAGMKNISFVEIPIETVYTDKYKGVSILDAYRIFFDILKWRVSK